MIPTAPLILHLPASPLRFEYLPVPVVAALFILIAIPIIRLGAGTIRWQGPARAWTSIGVRLAAVWVILMLLAGARWEHQNRDVEVIVLRDVSASTAAVPHPSGVTLADTIDDYLHLASDRKRSGDRLGVVSFDDRALIDSLPGSRARCVAHPIRDDHGGGTDLAAAVHLGLASFSADAMRRMVLITDGNATQGDTASALNAAMAAGVAVDVIPLTWRVDREIVVDHLAAPALRHEGEAFTVEVLLRSTNSHPVRGRIELTDRKHPIDLDPGEPGLQSGVPVTARANAATAVHIRVPAQPAGVHAFTAAFTPNSREDDSVAGNNTADAITVVRGRTRVLYVDNEHGSAGQALLDTLRCKGISIADDDHITPDVFPVTAIELQSYDAVVLANVPRGGPDGLSPAQERALVQYVRDLAGGLLVIGGPDALGAGHWQGSELEKILPLNMEPAPEHIDPPGALVLVVDHSGSMADPLSPASSASKQQVANESAVLAIEALEHEDFAGVLAFDTTPTWIVPLAPNSRPAAAESQIRCVNPGGGTSIYPALEQAYEALVRLPASQASVRHILLMTDGVSEAGDFDGLLAKMAAAKITLSTVAVGSDADGELLGRLARHGGGAAYAVTNPGQLPKIFVHEARTLRRPLIHQPPEGITLASGSPLPPLKGIVLTSAKRLSNVTVSIRSAQAARDPILADWQIGLGQAAVFTGDATSRWAPAWMKSPAQLDAAKIGAAQLDAAGGEFWSTLVRRIARAPASGDFEVSTSLDGPRTKLIVEALSSASGEARNFLSFTGKLAGPDPRRAAADIHLAQTGPGRYEADLDTPDAGAYVAAIEFQSPSGQRGSLLTGTMVPAAPELRELQSNNAFPSQATAVTGGRVLRAFDNGASLFSREGLRPSVSSRPITELLITTLMAIILMDVGVRRIAWNWQALRQLARVAGEHAHNFLTTRSVEPAVMLAALQKVRRDVADNKFRSSGDQMRSGAASHPPQFHGTPVISNPPPTIQRYAVPTAPTSRTCGLWEAKRRAMDVIRQKEQGKDARDDVI